jgi:membrane protease YdiL (CAAX protease family)
VCLGITGLVQSLFISQNITDSSVAQTQTGLDGLGSLKLFLLGVIFAPTFEELIFRGSLKQSLKYYFFVIGYLLSQVIITNLPKNLQDFFLANSNYELGLTFIFPFILAFGFYGLGSLVSKTEFSIKLNQKIDSFCQKNIRWLIVFSSLLFGLIHSGNLNLVIQYWYLAPLLTLFQTLSGFELSYIRLKFGMVFAIISHAFSNFLLVWLSAVLLSSIDLEKLSKLEAVNQDISSLDSSGFLGLAGLGLVAILVFIAILVSYILAFIELKKAGRVSSE